MNKSGELDKNSVTEESSVTASDRFKYGTRFDTATLKKDETIRNADGRGNHARWELN